MCLWRSSIAPQTHPNQHDYGYPIGLAGQDSIQFKPDFWADCRKVIEALSLLVIYSLSSCTSPPWTSIKIRF